MSSRPSDLRDLAIELYVSGLTHLEVVERVGVSDRKVRDWIREAGVSRPRGPRPLAMREAEIAAEEDIAYTGGWVRDGLVWRPAQTDAA